MGDGHSDPDAPHVAKTIKDVSPRAPRLFHDDILWLFNCFFFVFSFGLTAFLAYTGRTTLLAGSAPASFLAYYFILNKVLNLPRVDWNHEVVLITGGGTGIGAELALRLAPHTRVVVLTRQPPSYPIDTPNIYTYTCDVTDAAELATTAVKIRKEVGEPTVIVNNAGVVKGKLLLDLTPEDIHNTFGVNTIAPFLVLQEFLPAILREGRGHIVNISSVMGLIGTAQMADYCASKAAVVTFTESLRKELDYRYLTPAVRTTLVLPGHVTTGMFGKTHTPQGLLQRIAPSLTPTEVVDAIVATLDGGPGAQVDTVIRMPFYTQSARLLSPVFGLIPSPILRLGDWVSGAPWAMKEYGPSPDAGERLQAEREAKQIAD